MDEDRQGAGSRGIVICAGGARMFTNAYVLVRILRDTLHSRLPIEIWHMGPAEMSPAMRALLQDHGVQVVDAAVPIREAGGLIRDGWQLKSFALARSAFEEVLLLDADQVPVEDPASLFDWPEYRESGAVFWPDIVDLAVDNPVWAKLGLEPRRTRSMESGQVLVDRRRHGKALECVLALNERADEFYGLIYGDKDTFLLGWMLEGADFRMVPHAPFVHPRALIQRDFGGKALFQHRTNAKWALEGAQVLVENFVHEADCLRYLDDLGRLWGGRIYHAPARSPAARIVEAGLAGTRAVVDVVAGEGVEVEFLAHGEIGEGRSYERANWAILDRPEASEPSLRFTLIIEGGLGRAFTLHAAGPDQWVGEKVRAPGGVASLHARPAAVETDGLLPAFLAAAGYPVSSEETLEALLAVLDGVEPGVADRLRRLAGSAPEPSRLIALADRLDRHAGRRAEVRRPLGVLSTMYVPGSSRG